jgi:DNA helicase II / ATP-dependent DNA helicase PcrA
MRWAASPLLHRPASSPKVSQSHYCKRIYTHGQHSQGDRHVYASRSRFIPDRLLGLFEKTIWPLAVAGAATRAASQGPRIDVGARMRGMWR